MKAISVLWILSDAVEEDDEGEGDSGVVDVDEAAGGEEEEEEVASGAVDMAADRPHERRQVTRRSVRNIFKNVTFVAVSLLFTL